MLTQRLLFILKFFNNPANLNSFLELDLVPQDIDFLIKNGLKVDIIKKNSITTFCRLSRDIIEDETLEESQIKSI